MKIFKSTDVLTEAKNRVRRIFDEFDEVCVSFSGGKDSTATFFVALEIAREKKRLPLSVMFVDQEAEWQSTIDYMNIIMRMPEVKPYWFQAPFKIFNATSNQDQWLHCWNPEDKDKWVHPQVDISIKENVFTNDRFINTFPQALKYMFGNRKAANLGGVRCQESPARTAGLTGAATYKDITWGKHHDKANDQYGFYPLYDWEIKDIWKYIHDNDLPYNAHYDNMYQYGIPLHKMRVSNLHHETAIASLYMLQELEPKIWSRVTGRLGGVHAAGTLGESEFQVKKLPPMFANWREYRDYLMPRLILNKKDQDSFKRSFKKADILYKDSFMSEKADKQMVQCILANDMEMVKWSSFTIRQDKKPLQDAKRALKASMIKRRI